VPLISVMTPCYNEEGNVREAYERVKEQFGGRPGYEHEHVFIDNASTDGTVEILRALARQELAA